jgi:hypothetical protein
MIDHNSKSQLRLETHSYKKPVPKESLVLNLLFNLVVPTMILKQLSSEDHLGIKLAVITALAFPLVYGLRDLIKRKVFNFFSALGFISVLLTGGLTLLEMDAIYYAIKEASIPGLFGLATLLSLKTSTPLVRTFVLNENLVDIELILGALAKNERKEEFEALLINSSWILAGGFFLSASLNYGLAIVLLTAEPGTVLFNEQLGDMIFLSYPVIVLPVLIILMGNLYYLLNGISRITELPLERVFKRDG